MIAHFIEKISPGKYELIDLRKTLQPNINEGA